MGAVALIVLGAIIGAVVTGGVQLLAERRQRAIDRKVAARAILGDLFLAQGLAEGVMEWSRWPEGFESARPLETWHQVRGSFGASVSGGEWAEVDRVYQLLLQISLAASIGNESVEAARPLLVELRDRARAARVIARVHAAATDEEREAIEAVLEAPIAGTSSLAEGPAERDVP
jgi:hypothetical protein